MLSVIEVHNRIVTALRVGVAPATVYYNGANMPTVLPETGGQINPYIVLWAGNTRDAETHPLDASHALDDGRQARIRLMVCGPTPASAMHLGERAQRAIETITDLGAVIPDEYTIGPPYRDITASQTVWLNPLEYTINTN